MGIFKTFGAIAGGISGLILGGPAGALAGASLGGSLAGLAGGGKKASPSSLNAITGVSSTGFSTNLSDGRLTFSSNAGGLVSNADRAATGAISSLTALDPLIEAGTGRLSETTRGVFGLARERLAGDRRKSIGDLRQNLNRRRLLGSSFADDAINRKLRVFKDAANDIDVEENQALAGNFLQELDLKTSAIREKLNISLQSVAVELGQMNFESTLAAQISSNLNAVLSVNARFQTELQAQRASNTGAFLKQFLDPILTAGTEKITSKLGF